MTRSVGSTFISLRTRNYRLYFIGQCISVTGTWMQKVAQAWLVLELTGSGTLLGVTVAIQQLPTLVLGPWAGLLADRVDKRKMLLYSAAASAVPALLLGVLTLSGQVNIWLVLALSLAFGVFDAFDKPARHAFPTEMVGPELVTNAVMLNNLVQNTGKVVGPAIGGVLIASVGIPYTFLINSVSYVPVIAALAMMDRSKLSQPLPVPRSPRQLRAGLTHIRSTPHLLGTLSLLAVAGLLAFNLQVMLPLLARDFNGDARVVGYLFAAQGIGAILGALALAGVLNATLGALETSAVALAVTLIAITASPSLALTIALVALLGTTSTAFKAVASSVLQLGSDPTMRGRVMSLLVIAIVGTSPIGGPVVGWLAEEFSTRTAFGVAGVCTAAATVVAHFYLRHTSAQRALERQLERLSSAQPVTRADAGES